MSPRIAWGFALLLDGHRLPGVTPRELTRLRRRADTLASSEDRRDDIVSSWLASRASVHRFTVATADVADLRRDQQIVLSGVSDSRAELSAAGEVEGYIPSDQLSALGQEYLLVAKPNHGTETANVILRSIDRPIEMPAEVPRLMVVVDLIDRRESRAAGAADRLLDTVLSERLWTP
jgi:hypothetical protein